MAFQLGQTVSHYEFVDIVDSTPNRVAFRVRNLANNRFELLRVLGAAVQGDEEGEQRFFREASVHARLVHPNIVSFYRATTLNGQFVITTELAEGVTLAERLELGPLPVATAAGYFDQILSALSCAHQHGIVHRNISPSSVIVTPDSAIKLAGFTYAKGSLDPQLTQVGFTVGDVHYVSPEQIRGVTGLDPRCDIYSAGAVLYESLTGRKPFEGKSQFEILAAHVSAMPPAPSRLNPELIADWDVVVMRALAKDPSERFQTAAEFREAVARIRPMPAPSGEITAELPVYQPVNDPAAQQPPVPQTVAPRRWYTSLAWAVVAAAVFVIFFFMSSHQ